MLDFEYRVNPKTNQKEIHTSLRGKPLLTIPQLNKGTAFSLEERERFELLGKLPPTVETLDQQVIRAYHQFQAYDSNLKRNIYLNNLHDKNQILFYRMVSQHLQEMLPMIYTPIVGTAVKQYSREFRQPRGLYITYADRDRIAQVLNNRSNPKIDLIVVTDGEGILGIGDQGIGGMDIPVAKLMVYSLCGGIDPCTTLPICLDMGTNNQALLDDPMYLGWRHPRLQGKDYDEFMRKFIEAVKKTLPQVFLHWEDFGRGNADRFLQAYREEICSFNDDIQGTGAVAVAGILAALDQSKQALSDQRIVIFGAGTAGTGIASDLYRTIVQSGKLTETQAKAAFWLIDRTGVILNNQTDLTRAQQFFARDPQDVQGWQQLDLATVVRNVKPTVLIGCSAVAGAFSEDIVKMMASNVKRPIIFPLSNPTERAEATPEDLIRWTQGQVIVASGSPFADVTWNGRTYPIAQCNNALIFPGLGLGIIIVKATRITDNMLCMASKALSQCSPIRQDPNGSILPSLALAKAVAKKVAVAVAKAAISDGVATQNQEVDLPAEIEKTFWQPDYLPYVLRDSIPQLPQR